MASLVKTAVGHSMLIRVQLSLEQYAVFEWCSKNLGLGDMDDKNTLIKLLEAHLPAYRRDNPNGFNPKSNPLTAQSKQPPKHDLKKLQFDQLAASVKADLEAHREGRLLDEGVRILMDNQKQLIAMAKELGITVTMKPVQQTMTPKEQERFAWLSKQDFMKLSTADIDEYNHLSMKMAQQ